MNNGTALKTKLFTLRYAVVDNMPCSVSYPIVKDIPNEPTANNTKPIGIPINNNMSNKTILKISTLSPLFSLYDFYESKKYDVYWNSFLSRKILIESMSNRIHIINIPKEMIIRAGARG